MLTSLLQMRVHKVNSIDFLYLPSEIHRMDGNFMHSKVKDKDGFGLTAGYGYTPSKNFYQVSVLNIMTNVLILNDMGYLILNDRLCSTAELNLNELLFKKVPS